MIVLDTNVVSELIKPHPHPAVATWILQVPHRRTFLAASSVAELLYGVQIMPAGRRRETLALRLAQFMGDLEVLPFDDRAAGFYATIVANRRAAGTPISVFDGQIAAIARTAGAKIATRDAGFVSCGVEIINPWLVT